MNHSRLAIIHTTPATIQGMGRLCARLLPGVMVNHYLDDSILWQINAEGGVSPSCRFRYQALLGVAAANRPDAILSACSSVGELLEEARAIYPMPLVRIDEPMAREAAKRGGRIVVCATVRSTLEPTTRLIRRYAGNSPVDPLLIDGAGELLASGDRTAYLDLIASRLEEAASGHETVVLAQASMADALERLRAGERDRYLTSPESGVAALRGLFGLE